MPASFFDTNILLYTASPDAAKAERARSLIQLRGTISVQVLNEVANIARRKLRLDWNETARLLRPFHLAFEIVDLTVAMHGEGLRLAQRYQLAIHDAMIVAAALVSGCDTLWSEDMHDGLVVDERLTIRNPFR